MTRKIKLIKGASYTGHGVKATKEKPEIFVEEATAEKAVASGYFEYVSETASAESAAEKSEVPEIPEDDEIVEGYAVDDMTLAQLKDIATQMGINTRGLKNKASYVEAIETAGYGQGSPTMIKLQEE